LVRLPEQVLAGAPAPVPNGHLWCGKCAQVKPTEQFYATNKWTCAECFRAYRQRHYRLNRAAYVERNTRLLRGRRHNLAKRLWE
jgi:hypothetical protein